MDINLLSKMVAELILSNDEVSLPGLGTFVAEMVPASFSDKGFTINPPYRKLSFRQRDGGGRELIEFYAGENKVEEADAERMIDSFIAELRAELVSRKSVTFPGLGRLRATKENHFFFVPDEELNIYPEGFGLVPVSLKFHEESQEELSSAIRDLKELVGSETEDSVSPLQSQPTLESQPVREPQQTTDPQPDPETQPASETQVTGHHTPEKPQTPKLQQKWDSPHVQRPRRRMSPWLIAALSIAAAVILFFGALAVFGRVAPELIDPLLYTPEELSILYR